jgi:tetratricopeptide (TPR) repeat protein
MINSIRDEFQKVIIKARELAIEFGHDFIDYEHFFVAMLNLECHAQKYLSDCDVRKYHNRLATLFSGGNTISDDGSLPLTVRGERIIKHCDAIAAQVNDEEVGSIHLLLAIISYNNSLAELLKKSGIIFYEIVSKAIMKPMDKFHPPIRLLRRKPYSALGKFFLSKAGIKNKVTAFHEQAIDLFEFEEYDDCIKICKVGKSLSANYEPFMALIAYSYFEKRELKEALGHFLKLCREYPGSDDYFVTLAYIYDDTGMYLKAEEILDTLLAKLPDNETVLNNKAFNLCNQGKFKEAILYYERAIAIDPDFAYAWDNLGYAKYKLGDTEEALSLIEKSLQLDKGNSYAYKYKGIIFMEQNNKVAALENFNLALKYGYTKKYGEKVMNLIQQLS